MTRGKRNNKLEIIQSYNKRKLVPFGEFIPLENFLDQIALENDVKIICSLFALGVFAGNFTIGGTIMNSYTGHAKAFAMLQETGVELSPMATGYIEYFGTEMTGMPNPVMMLVGVTGLLIALAPLWFNSSD